MGFVERLEKTPAENQIVAKAVVSGSALSFTRLASLEWSLFFRVLGAYLSEHFEVNEKSRSDHELGFRLFSS